MRKIKVVDTVANRYFIGETTSGSTSDIYLTDGKTTIKLEDCLIWDSESFDDEEFYSIVEDCKANEAEMREMGWTIVEETA
jgi:hypothetical protein